LKPSYGAVEQEEEIEINIIEKEEEICNRVWMKDVLIHYLIFHRD